MLDRALVRVIREQFTLDWHGIHGASHWARVRENGLRLAEATGARTRVVELFAFLHGARAALFAQSLAGSVFDLDAVDLDLLMTACRGHSEGMRTGDITVLTCWDADRLDLGRVGIRPSPQRLCTEAARDSTVIEWAYRRSIR